MRALQVSIPFSARDIKRARSTWESLVVKRIAKDRHVLAIRLSGPAILAEQEELTNHPSTIFHIEENPETYNAMVLANRHSNHPDALVVQGEFHESVIRILPDEAKPNQLIWLDADYTCTFVHHADELKKHWDNILNQTNSLGLDELFITQTFATRRDDPEARQNWWNKDFRYRCHKHGYEYSYTRLAYGNPSAGMAFMVTVFMHVQR